MATETWVLNDTINQYSGATTGDFRPGVSYLLIEFETNGYNVKSLIIDSKGSYTSTGGWGIGIQSTTSPSSGSDTVYMYQDGGGWTNTAFNTWVFPTVPTGDLLTWLQANGTKQAATPKGTVDLTSLSGYESLPAGTYQLGVKARASGYQDSDLSSTVNFTKLAAPVATASDTTVTWDAITNAESYDVYVDGELYENTTGGG